MLLGLSLLTEMKLRLGCCFIDTLLRTFILLPKFKEKTTNSN